MDVGDKNSFRRWLNYNEDRRSGFDFSLQANKKFGDFVDGLGFNGMVFTSTALKREEVYADDYQYREGRPLDVY